MAEKEENDANVQSLLLLICCSFLTWFGHDSPAGQFFLSAVSLSRQDFSYCPLSRILHVTLANWQRFGFEFHLGSSPSAFSGFVNISQPAAYFTWGGGGGGGGGLLSEKLGGSVRPASQNPYPIYDQNLQYSLPYL